VFQTTLLVSSIDRNGKVLWNLDNSDRLKTEIAYNMPVFTAMTRNHGNGQKSRYTVKITVITAIVSSWFSYRPTHRPNILPVSPKLLLSKWFLCQTSVTDRHYQTCNSDFFMFLFVCQQDFDILSSYFPMNTQMVYILSLGVVKEYRRHGVGVFPFVFWCFGRLSADNRCTSIFDILNWPCGHVTLLLAICFIVHS